LIRLRFDALIRFLDEGARRRFVTAEARACGHGGVTLFSKVTGIARGRSIAALRKSKQTVVLGSDVYGGRRFKTQGNPTLLDYVQSLLEASTRSDTVSPLLWTSKSLDRLCTALKVRRSRMAAFAQL
jgi:hypothetical protein